MLCGISFGFPELFAIEGQIAHVLRTRAPCAIPYCYSTRTRLACVKHAASVRSEPGSNSRLNLVAWRKKIFRSFDRNQPAKRIVDRSNLLRPLALEKLQWFRTDSGTPYRLQKSEAPLSSRRAHQQPKKNAKAGKNSKNGRTNLHGHTEWA